MVPHCETMGDGVALALIPNSLVPRGGQIDAVRVGAIVAVRDLKEVESGYNRRTCRGVIALKDGSGQYDATFRFEQAEGAQNWQEITFLDQGKPEFDHLIAKIQKAYIEEEK